MAQTKFRSLPLRTTPARVDRENRVIYGASAMQAVEALGHDMTLDAKTLQQVCDLGNAAKNGMKSRFTHPGLSSDGMGKHLGRMKNFRVEGDKTVGDLHLADSASKAPDGDLAGYVMDLAEEDSAAFGMSVVIEADKVWTFEDGHEQDASETIDPEDMFGRPVKPKDALTKVPVARVKALYAVDVVDEPAANRDGMFSAALWGTNQLAENMFGNFDGLLSELGMTPAQAWGYALKYFDARGVRLKGIEMNEQNEATEVTESADEIIVAVEIENEGEEEVTQEEMKTLQAELAAIKQREQDALAQAAQLAETVATMQKEARAARFQKLAAGWQGEIAAHLTVLEALGEGSEAYGAYCQLQGALSAQIEAGGLFKELGRNSQTDGSGSPTERLNKLAVQRANEMKISLADATKQVMAEHSGLYDQHRDEAAVTV